MGGSASMPDPPRNGERKSVARFRWPSQETRAKYTKAETSGRNGVYRGNEEPKPTPAEASLKERKLAQDLENERSRRQREQSTYRTQLLEKDNDIAKLQWQLEQERREKDNVLLKLAISRNPHMADTDLIPDDSAPTPAEDPWTKDDTKPSGLAELHKPCTRDDTKPSGLAELHKPCTRDDTKPSGLAELYKDLHETEWKEARANLVEQCYSTDDQAIRLLLKVLMETYKTCKRIAAEELEELRKNIAEFEGKNEPSPAVMNTLHRNRKLNYQGRIARLKPAIMESLKQILTTPTLKRAVRQFRSRSLKLCWLFVLQDPPLFIEPKIKKKGLMLDYSALKTCTITEQKTDFVVWPILYLYEGGPVLSKGIAQWSKVDRSPRPDVTFRDADDVVDLDVDVDDVSTSSICSPQTDVVDDNYPFHFIPKADGSHYMLEKGAETLLTDEISVT